MKKLTRKQTFMLATRQAGDLLNAGVSLSDLLNAGVSLSDLLNAGVSWSALLNAGASWSDLLNAGVSWSALRNAGVSLSDLLNAGVSWSDLTDEIAAAPKLDKPYTRLLADIKAKRRVHKQSTFGPDDDPATNICKTPMCTAGHLVNMAGEEGYALKQKYGFADAAAILHFAAHPDWPCQNFGAIPQEWALVYIEEMAAREAAEQGE